MFFGNILVFSIVVIVICLVDFSAFSLEESTERLFYYEESESVGKQQEVRGETNQEVSSGESSEGNSEESSKELDELDELREKIDNVESCFNEETTEEKAEEGKAPKSGDIKSEETVPTHNLDNLINEKKKKTKPVRRVVVPANLVGSGNEKKHEVSVEELEDDIGMSSDFCDDFADMSNLIRKIHEEGGGTD